MPNHITNRITSNTDLTRFVEKKMDERGSDYQAFDFNQFIPIPECLKYNLESAGGTPQMVAEIALGLIEFADHSAMPEEPLASNANMKKATSILHRASATRHLVKGPMAKDLSDERFEEFVKIMRAYRECGSMSWYDWNIANWGTKWNSYNVNLVSPTHLEFDTAWSAPHPVIEAMAKQHNIAMRHEWADEDTGSNVGYTVYGDNGNILDCKELSGTKEGYELAFELQPGRKENYIWDEINQKYVWYDSDDEDEQSDAVIQ